MAAIADKLRQIFSSSSHVDDDINEDFYKAKMPKMGKTKMSKTDKAKMPKKELDLEDEDVAEDIYSEGSEDDFDEEDEYDEGMDDEDDEDEYDEDMDDDDMPSKKSYKKSDNSINQLISDQSTLEDATVGLIKEYKKIKKSNEDLAEEVSFLKAKLSKFLDEPVNRKEPVFTKSYEDSGLSSGVIKSKIKEGIDAGQLSVSDMLSFEASRNLTPAAKRYITSKENA